MTQVLGAGTKSTGSPQDPANMDSSIASQQPTCTIRRHHKSPAGVMKIQQPITSERCNPKPSQTELMEPEKTEQGSLQASNSSLAEKHRKLSKLLEYLSDKIRLVKLRQLDPSSKLGFSLRGGKEATGSSVGVFVSHVERLSEAHRKGLKVGDRLIEVNGLSVNEATYDQVIALIKRTPRAHDIVLRVQNLAKIPVQERAGEPIQWLPVLELLMLDTKAAQDFTYFDEDTSSITGAHLDYYSGNVSAGTSQDMENLELELEVAGYEDEGMGSFEEARDMARSLSDSEAAGSEAGSSELSSTCVELHQSNLGKCNDQSTDSAVSSATLGSSSSSSSSSSSAYSVSVSSLCSEKQQATAEGMRLGKGESDLVQICLLNDNSSGVSFGCGVVKGPDEWPGIFVQNVSPGSLAERVGLEPGDQLISAQGQQLQELPFDDAIKLIKRLQLHQTRLMLEVRKGAALRHLAAHGMACRPEVVVRQLDAVRALSGSGGEHPQRRVASPEEQSHHMMQQPEELQVASDAAALQPQPRRSLAERGSEAALGVVKQEVERQKLGCKVDAAVVERHKRNQRPSTPPASARLKEPPSSPEEHEDDEQRDEEKIRIVGQSYKLHHPATGSVLQPPLLRPAAGSQQRIPTRCPNQRQAPTASSKLRPFDEMRLQMEQQTQVRQHQALTIQQQHRLTRFVSMDNINETVRICRPTSRPPVESNHSKMVANCCANPRQRIGLGAAPSQPSNYGRTTRPSSALGRQCIGCIWRPARQLQQHHLTASMASVRLVKARSMDKLSLIGAQPTIYPTPTDRMIRLRPSNHPPAGRLLDHQPASTCCYLVPACQRAALRKQQIVSGAGSPHYSSATNRRAAPAGSCCAASFLDENQQHRLPQTTVIYTSRKSCYQQTSCCLVGGDCMPGATSVCTAPTKLRKQRSTSSTCCCSGFCLYNSHNSQQPRMVPSRTTTKSRDSAIITDHSSGYHTDQQQSKPQLVSSPIVQANCGVRLRALSRPYKGCAPQPPPPPPPPPPPAETDIQPRERVDFRQRVSTFFATSPRPSCSAELVADSDVGNLEPEERRLPSNPLTTNAVNSADESLQDYKAAVRLVVGRKRGPSARPSPPPCPPPPPIGSSRLEARVSSKVVHQVMRPLKDINNNNNNNNTSDQARLIPAINRLGEPLGRLCFVDELKMLAERQEKPAGVNASTSADTCPLIKIINASKQAGKRPAPKSTSSACSCSQPSNVVGELARQASNASSYSAGCSTLMANHPSTTGSSSSKPDSKCRHELATTTTNKTTTTTLSTLAEEDNKRRQHELLMKEFKSAHLRMFNRRNNNQTDEQQQQVPDSSTSFSRLEDVSVDHQQQNACLNRDRDRDQESRQSTENCCRDHQPEGQQKQSDTAGTFIKTINTKRPAAICTRSSPLVRQRLYQQGSAAISMH